VRQVAKVLDTNLLTAFKSTERYRQMGEINKLLSQT
jgi:hypothetical protein